MASRGYSLEFLVFFWNSSPPGSPNPDPISDQKRYPQRFKTGPVKNYVIITDWKSNPKKVSESPFWICIRSYTPVLPSKTIRESRPNRAKVYTRFQTRTVQKPYPLGRYILPPGVAWSMYVYRQPRALQSTDKIEIFLYVSLICIYKSLVIGINAFFRCLYLYSTVNAVVVFFKA